MPLDDKVEVESKHSIKSKKIKEIKTFALDMVAKLAVMVSQAKIGDFQEAKKIEKLLDADLDKVKPDSNLLKAVYGRQMEVYVFISSININHLPESSRVAVNEIYSEMVVALSEIYNNITIDSLPSGYEMFLEQYGIRLEQVMAGTEDEMVNENGSVGVDNNPEQIDNNIEGCQMQTGINNQSVVQDGNEGENLNLDALVKTDVDGDGSIVDIIKDANNELDVKDGADEILGGEDTEDTLKEKEETLEETCEKLNVAKPVQANTPEDKEAVKSFSQQATDAIKNRLKEVNDKKDAKPETSILMDYVVPGVSAIVIGAAIGYVGVKIYEAVTSNDNSNGWI